MNEAGQVFSLSYTLSLWVGAQGRQPPHQIAYGESGNALAEPDVRNHCVCCMQIEYPEFRNCSIESQNLNTLLASWLYMCLYRTLDQDGEKHFFFGEPGIAELAP